MNDPSSPPSLKELAFKTPEGLLATGFGLGLSPRAPGTVGTLLGIPLAMASFYLQPLAAALLLVGCFFVGVHVCEQTSRRLGVHDHGGIVWDEVVGYMIAVLGYPPTLFWLGLGFVLFRLFDIWKPWPIGLLDRKVGGGLGIMLDDVIAGVYAWLCLQGVVGYLLHAQGGA